MQRASAILLLVLFSLPLIPPTLSPDNDSKLPACCRKDGKHHCSMASTVADREQSSGPAIQGVRARCGLFPTGGAAPASGKASTPGVAQSFVAAVVSHPAAHAQTEAQYRVSFSRAWQKRGPPSLLS